MMSTEHAPESSSDSSSGADASSGRRGRRLHMTAAQKVAKAERALARERERRAELGEEVRALKLEVRRLQRIVDSTDVGRIVALQQRLERTEAELREWRRGNR